jgi:hypothetical protein
MNHDLTPRPRRRKPAARSRVLAGVASVAALLALGAGMANGAVTSVAGSAPKSTRSTAPASSSSTSVSSGWGASTGTAGPSVSTSSHAS